MELRLTSDKSPNELRDDDGGFRMTADLKLRERSAVIVLRLNLPDDLYECWSEIL
jgi:hypothetical protein